MLTWLRNKLFGGPVPCDHKKNWKEERLIECGTPMVRFQCRDCDFYDRGHVYANSEGWEGVTECVQGVVTKH